MNDGIAWDFTAKCPACDGIMTFVGGVQQPHDCDGTDVCCTDACTDACGGYGRMLEEDARRRVAFIGQPSAGKTTTASCCGEREDLPIEEEPLDIPLPGFVGMLRGGRADLAAHAKRIVREDADLLRRLAPNDGPICKCPVEACVCRGRP